MKKAKILYWIATALMAAFMLMASIPDVIQHPKAVAMITHLGYPVYVVPFIGVLKILAVIVGGRNTYSRTSASSVRCTSP